MRDNQKKFQKMLKEVFLLDEGEYTDSYSPDQIKTWDSFATLVLAAAIEHYFGVKLEAKEVIAIKNIGDIKKCLRNNGAVIK